MDKDLQQGSLYRNSVSYFGGLIILIGLVLINLFLLLSTTLVRFAPPVTCLIDGGSPPVTLVSAATRTGKTMRPPLSAESATSSIKRAH